MRKDSGDATQDKSMKKIGRYIIRALLGRGGMSKVYRVSLPVIEGAAALKLLAPHPCLTALLGTQKIREQFSAEARTMAGLRHPHIAAIRDFDEVEGKRFYVMEYFSNNLGDLIGETYRTEAPSRILSMDKAIHYTRQILSGVSRLHHDGIIHRDIKPFNLLITETDAVKLCDFGLSTLRGETAPNPANLKVGSPFYAAPEQEDAPDQVGFESDIFSIGVVLYRMITGRLPYPDPDASPTPVSRLNPDLDSNWDEFIFSALHKNPRKRTPSAKAMSTDLEKLAAAWTHKKQAICMLAEPAPAKSIPPAATDEDKPLRSRGIKVAPRVAGKMFQTDALWQPLRYHATPFRTLAPLLIRDPQSGLVWQQAGSAYPFSWREARAYIDRLNRRRFEGLDAWRLPTVEELMTLLTPPLRNDAFCMPPVFDTMQKWLWSADRSSFTAAWYINLELGYVAKNDFSALYFAKAVCTHRG
jgi:serine/threonine-protein kinase